MGVHAVPRRCGIVLLIDILSTQNQAPDIPQSDLIPRSSRQETSLQVLVVQTRARLWTLMMKVADSPSSVIDSREAPDPIKLAPQYIQGEQRRPPGHLPVLPVLAVIILLSGMFANMMPTVEHVTTDTGLMVDTQSLATEEPTLCLLPARSSFHASRRPLSMSLDNTQNRKASPRQALKQRELGQTRKDAWAFPAMFPPLGL